VVRLRLFGRDYSIRGHGNREYLERLGDYITEKADAIQDKSHPLSTLDLAVLSLLSVTDELFQIRLGDSRTRQESEDNTEEADNTNQTV
jgi:cell division protein ZapA